MIAWTSGRDGPPEVYLAAIDGGNGRRLTYWGDRRTRGCGWTPDGDVVAITASGQPFGHFTWAYTLALGEPAGPGDDPLPFGPVTDLAIDSDGVALLTGAFRSDPALWKRYRGGTSGRLSCGRQVHQGPRLPPRPVRQPYADRRQAGVPRRS